MVSLLVMGAWPAGATTEPGGDAGPDPTTAGIAMLLTGEGPLVIDGCRLDVRALRQLYESRGYAPLWLTGADDGRRVQQVADAVARSQAHGLDPALYHGRALERRAAATTADDRAAYDLLASDAVMRLGSHLRQGAVRPDVVDKDATVAPRPLDLQALAIEAAAAPDLVGHIDGLAPQTAAYRGLMDALGRYRELAAAGGWPKVPAKGAVIKPGTSDPAIPLVRKRLAATGEYAGGEPADGSANRYDDGLVEAVKEFQSRHGLVADGIIGPPTRAALALPVTDRLKQIAANLERARWFPEELGHRYVAVNVPSFELVVVENGNTILKMPVVVGRTDRRTPVLSSTITEVVFNPTWTVPPTLMREDFLPKMRRNQSYAARRGMQLVGSRNPTLRQPPGPRNPLGRVKFLMPNDFAVYLHDTNAKGLMRQQRRALSSGCVRLGDALGLADQLLANDPRWTPATRKQFLRGWTTRYMALREPVPVYLKYQTAWRDDGGIVHFREDIYGRDAALGKVLGGQAGSTPPAIPKA